jgi:hypothetical protein
MSLHVTPRKRGSRAVAEVLERWIPAFAGMTSNVVDILATRDLGEAVLEDFSGRGGRQGIHHYDL